ncbi:MAG: DUF4837 family protein [Bacteroidales bacterium]|nr:DUF4837 family protein [Bacteroidales bacterium]MDD4669796.1 DUF4837 family protein [Bacteroidales bacterium]
MKKVHFLLAGLIAIVLFISCSDNGDKNKALLPSISGKAGEIAVISTKGQWESEPGTTIRNILAGDCPYLPQKEPLYNLFNVPQNAFNKVFQGHRNLLYINIDNQQQEASMNIRQDIWAQPQTMLEISAPNVESATRFINDNAEKITSVFEQAERDRVIRNAKLYEVINLRTFVTNRIGGSPYFPDGYSLKKQTPDFIWISYETSFTNQGIFIYKFPYESPEQFTPKYIIQKRDEVMKENVPASTDNSYMMTNPTIDPGFRWVKYRGREFAETKSLWDTQNDFMGGPFVSHSFLSKDKKEVIVVEGFVYAPKYPKRNYLRQVESILYSFEWADKQTK